jgi:hypothetical protein
VGFVLRTAKPPQKLEGWKSYEMVKRYGHLTVEHLRAFAEHKKGIPNRASTPRHA